MCINSYLVLHGFIIPANEIYGGRKGWYDYAHLGVLLKKNIQALWEKTFVHKKENVYLMDACIFTSKETLTASGHIQNFNDILVDCKNCKRRYREDHLNEKKCEACGSTDFTSPKPFNLIYKTDEDTYLRPETAQNIFINFKNILRIHSPKVPFAVAQVGKSFRNEITLSNSIFRTKEFEQMEFELFINPKEENDYFDTCLREMHSFLVFTLGMKATNIRFREIEDRAHYSTKSYDLEFHYPHGWGELWGLANRTDYDLKAHSEHSKKELIYLDPTTKEKYIPHILEHSVGLNRLLYAIVCDAYEKKDDREFLRLHPDIAPYKFAVLPLTKKEHDMAEYVYKELRKNGLSAIFMPKGSIGKRYKKNDLIGTPYCLTLDELSGKDKEEFTFTIRYRDSTYQSRISWQQFVKNGFKRHDF